MVKNTILATKKAQSITEIATFGAILILALSYLVRYGMLYNYQQQVQMEAFRIALNQAAVNNYSGLNSGPSLTLVKDMVLPDPSDRFGHSNRVSVKAEAEISWTNESQRGINATDYDPNKPSATKSEKLPQVEYIFNPQLGAGNVTKNYTTANFVTDQTIYPIPLSVLDQDYNITAAQTKIIKIEPTDEKKVKVLLGNDANCGSAYCPTDILISADLDHDDKREEQIITPSGNPGEQLNLVEYVDYQKGDIDPDMLQVDLSRSDPAKRVTPENVQGLLTDGYRQTQRSDTLTLSESPKQTTSVSALDQQETVQYKIRKYGGAEEAINFVFQNQTNQTWETTK